MMLALVWILLVTNSHAQYEIKPQPGYSPQIGILVDMLQNVQQQIFDLTKDLSQEDTDYLFDDQANSIGALIMHLAATEAYYQVETLEERPFTEKEGNFWGMATG